MVTAVLVLEPSEDGSVSCPEEQVTARSHTRAVKWNLQLRTPRHLGGYGYGGNT